MNGSLLSSLPSIAIAVLVLIAMFVLWDKDRSPWLILAIAAEIASLCLHALLMIVPDAIGTMKIVFLLWPLAGLLFAGGLLGYAIERHKRT